MGQLLLTTKEEIRKGLPKLRRSFMLLGGMMGEMFQKEESSSTDGGVMALRVTKKKPQLTRICSAASTAAAPGRSTPAKG